MPFIDPSILPDRDSYTFKNTDISSMTVSMHKMLGLPVPANIFIARQSVIEQFKQRVEHVPYLGEIKDITVYGSRDGFRAALVYERLHSVTAEQMRDLVSASIERTHIVVNELSALGLTSTFSQPGGVAVVILIDEFDIVFTPEHRAFLVKKYRMAQNKDVMHLYIMAHVTQAMCDEFITDCRNALK